MNKMQGQIKKSFFLILCVFIFYQDMCACAMAAQNLPRGKVRIFGKISGYNSHGEFTKILVEHEEVSNQKFLEDLMQEGFNVSNPNDICADWQEFDGTTCVCSDHCDANNEIDMGIVCDTDGKKFRNLCNFAYKMCSSQIPTSTQLTTCGVCNTLKLTGSLYYPENKLNGLGIFTKDTFGNIWTSKDDLGNEIKLFYSNESETWIVGSADFTQAGIIFMNYTKYPQDMKGGAVIAINETYSQLDSFLHFECIPDSMAVEKRGKQHLYSRQKRFIFGQVQTFQDIVKQQQQSKGCFYYPDLCRIKNEIKNTLKPEVESLKSRFNSIIGDSSGFRGMVHNVFQDLLDLKEKMVTLRKLEEDFQDLSHKFGQDLKYLSPQIAANFDLSFYYQWLKALKDEDTWAKFVLVQIQNVMEIISLITSIASKASIAFAAIGVFIGLIHAVISIVLSAKAEEKQRDELRNVKRDLIEGRQKLKLALSHVEGFQIQFYETVIYPLKKFTYHMRNYDSHFQMFYDHLVRVFGPSMSKNVDKGTYAKITSSTIKNLRNQQLSPLISFLSYNLNELELKIKSYKQNKKLITLIRNTVNQKLFPKEIYSLIKHEDATLAIKLVPTEFSLLRFISEKVLTNESCYWGYKLNGVRQGSVTSSNYRSVSLCNSPELYNIEMSLNQLTNQNMSPSRIAVRIQHDRFINKYQKLKYMADFVLTAKPCYWGYSLALIRKDNISVSELNDANPTKSAFISVKLLPENNQATALCSSVKICNSNWQIYTKCLLKYFDGGSMCAGAGSC